MTTIMWEGLELPAEIQSGNFLMKWKEEPEDRVIDKEGEPLTYDAAFNHYNNVFLEEGIYRNNYFFVRAALRNLRRSILPRKRKDWTPEQKKDYREGKYDDDLRTIANARFANRERWQDLKAEYREELEDLRDLCLELAETEKVEKQRREEEKRREEAERQRAKRAKQEEKKRAWEAELARRDDERAQKWATLTTAERPDSRSECEDRLRALESEFYDNKNSWPSKEKEVEYRALRKYHQGKA